MENNDGMGDHDNDGIDVHDFVLKFNIKEFWSTFDKGRFIWAPFLTGLVTFLLSS